MDVAGDTDAVEDDVAVDAHGAFDAGGIASAAVGGGQAGGIGQHAIDRGVACDFNLRRLNLYLGGSLNYHLARRVDGYLAVGAVVADDGAVAEFPQPHIRIGGGRAVLIVVDDTEADAAFAARIQQADGQCAGVGQRVELVAARAEADHRQPVGLDVVQGRHGYAHRVFGRVHRRYGAELQGGGEVMSSHFWLPVFWVELRRLPVVAHPARIRPS